MDSELYDALVAAGIPDARARAVSDAMQRAITMNQRRLVPDELMPIVQRQDELRIIVLDATTCFIAGHKTVSLEVALEIMRALRSSDSTK